MRRLLEREFWVTPISGSEGTAKLKVLLVFLLIVLVCIIIGGCAAWRLINLQ